MTIRRRVLLHGIALAAPGALTARAAERPSTARPGVHVLAPALAMPGLDRTRTLRVYLPPGYAPQSGRRYPVIYMHDGQNLFDDATSFAGEWGVDETMDEIARTTGFEAIVVGIDHGGEHRIHELAPWPNPKYGAAEGAAYLAFIVDVVKPFIDLRYRTQPGRETTAIVGSSLGALASHAALLRHPQVFGKAGLFSPSYWFSGQVYDETRAHPWPIDTRLYLYIGGRESEEAVPDMQRMFALLRAAGLAAPDRTRLHIEPLASHDERAWRAEFGLAVRWLFKRY